MIPLKMYWFVTFPFSCDKYNNVQWHHGSSMTEEKYDLKPPENKQSLLKPPIQSLLRLWMRAAKSLVPLITKWQRTSGMPVARMWLQLPNSGVLQWAVIPRVSGSGNPPHHPLSALFRCFTVAGQLVPSLRPQASGWRSQDATGSITSVVGQDS